MSAATSPVIAGSTIDVPADGWEVTARDGAKPARLVAKEPLVICGLRMHLEAWRVVQGKRNRDDAPAGAQMHPYDDEDFARLWRVFSNGDGDFTTTRLPGHSGKWILLASPFVN